MAARKKPADEPEEPSKAAGKCVLVVLGGGALAAVFAVWEGAGVLTVWLVGVVAVYRSARRMSDSRTTPPPPLSEDVYAAHSDEIARVQEGPGEGLLILYPKPVDEGGDR
ncbi:hypothetical protein J7E95_34415 [Streptomyces sp. ISL-14]|nr:hypothetical protein [Streptomyces sp. ISL-14]